jgi:Putative zinc binding domain
MRRRRAAMAIHRAETACRACGGGDLAPILAFGASPLADRLLREDQLAQADVAVPLTRKNHSKKHTRGYHSPFPE